MLILSIVVMAVSLTSLYVAANEEYLMKIQIIFRCVHSLFAQLYCLKFWLKSVDTSKSYARKQNWVFFLNTVYKQYQ